MKISNYFIVVFTFLPALHAVMLKNCDNTTPIQLSLTRSPDVVTLKNNASFHISAGISMNRYTIPQRLRVLVDTSKRVLLVWHKIPCVECDFSLSCKETPQICQFNDMCNNCSMNVKNIKLNLPVDIEDDLPGYLPNIFINGHYWVKLNIVNEDDHNERVACIEVEATIQTST